MRDFLGIRKGDIVLAYTKDRRISYVGEVTSNYKPNQTKNAVGKPEKMGGFEYPNQFKVKWWDEPYDFFKEDLGVFGSQIGKPYKTVTPIELGRLSFERFKKFLATGVPSGSASHGLDEDTIKAGILKYLKGNLDVLESGLKPKKAERRITEKDQPDFMAEDARGREVLIECKGTAGSDAVEQLERYGKSRRDARLMLIAYRIDEECRRIAKGKPRIELYECDLKFTRASD
ncbi:MAG: hypothetical protein ABSB53_03870 [Nitrososphaerales archaeon]|jgi:hypothetical protein